MPNDLAISLKHALLGVVAPLRESARDPRLLDDWLATLGYTRTITADPALRQIAAQCEAIGASLESLDDASLDAWSAVADLLAIGRRVGDVRTALQQFASAASRAPIAASLPDDVMTSLLATWLRRTHPLAFRVGGALGAVEMREMAAPDPALVVNGVVQRHQRTRDRFDEPALRALLASPGAALASRHLPNGMASPLDASLAAGRLFPILAALADALGLSWRIEQRPSGPVPPPDPIDAGPPDELPLPDFSVDLAVLPPALPQPSVPYLTASFPTFVVRLAGAGATEVTLEVRASSAQHPGALAGLLVVLAGTFQTSQTSGPWTITLASTGALPAFAVTPTTFDVAAGSATAAGGTASLKVRRTAAQNGGAPYVLGDPTGTRLELGAPEIDVALSFDPARRALGISLGASQAKLVVAPPADDGFLAELLPANGFEVPFDLGVSLSTDRGLTLRGHAGLEGDVPVGQSIAGVSLSRVHVGLTADATTGVRALATAALKASIGPVRASIDGIGIVTRVAMPPNGGNLGVADLALGFQPPQQIGLAVDLAGTLSGGGFLALDPVHGVYAGALQLTLRDRLTLTALGVLVTRLPDGAPGYSLLVFITAEGFQPVPLILGFRLTAIGGMLGLHRTFDVGVLRAGLKTDLLGALLFPRDPAGNASTVLTALSTAFPVQRGSHLLGLLLQICWGASSAIRFDLAVIVEIGQRTRLLVLGRASVRLPTPDNDLIRLTADAIGVVDLDQETIAIDAVLVDSRIANKFAISGGAAFRAGWGTGPGNAFIYSVGGFNPRFVPPAGVPALDRVTIALASGANPRLTCEAYFAVTSNTLQFGARAHLYATYAGFAIEGDVGFDVLVQLAPFHFLADYHASVQLMRGGRNLFKVSVEGTLEGPRPLRLRGKATFSILFWDVSFSFDATLVSGQKPSLPPAVDVEGELIRALTAPAAWRSDGDASRTHGVALRPVPVGQRLLLDPLGRMVVTQDVVPLASSRPIDLFGGAPVSGARTFALTAAIPGQGPLVAAPVSGSFAPAQLYTMTDDERLVSQSFETSQAGLVLGSTAVDFDGAGLVGAGLDYDEIKIDTLPDPDPQVPLPAATPYQMSPGRLAAHVATGAAARAPVRRVGRSRFELPDVAPAVALATPQWAITSLDAPSPIAVGAGVTTWSEHQGVLDVLNRGGARYQLVSAWEVAS